jgi:glycosyltransferase involved in cell wall biosynthesis
MRPLKIVHMTSVHSALDHRIFDKECRSLARAGFEVTIVGPHPQDTVKSEVRIKSIAKDRSRFLRMTKTAWRVYREAKKQGADVYHFHDPELIPVALLLRAHGQNVVYDVHEDYPRDILFKSYLPGWTRRLIAGVAEAIEHAASRRFSAIVAVTPAIASRFESINRRTVVLYNYPHAEDLLSDPSSSWQMRKQAVTYVGTITPQRGIREIVQAMALVPASLSATLEIAGDHIPEDVKKLPSWTRVKFHGILDLSSTYRLLHQVRAGLVCEHPIATFTESMPVKIFEYMGAGLPVIASDFPLWRRMLEGVGCAIFVDPRNVQEIAQAIAFLLSNSAEAEAMGQRGREAVANRFNWNTQAQKLVDLYSGLAARTCAA